MNENASGRKWARGALVIGMALSVGGNFTHALLAESEISSWLRVWPALFLPIIAFVAIEVLIRIDWQRKASWQIARVLIILPLISAGVSSFEHLRSLLLLMGERDFTAWWVPGAIDGLIIGATVVLVVTRPRPASPVLDIRTLAPVPPTERTILTDEEVEEITAKWERHFEEEEAARITAANEWAEEEAARFVASITRVDEIIPTSPAPVTRSPTSSLADGMNAVEMLLNGMKPKEVATKVEAAESTVYRWSKVLRQLQHNPGAMTTERVSADLIEYMRERVREIEAERV